MLQLRVFGTVTLEHAFLRSSILSSPLFSYYSYPPQFFCNVDAGSQGHVSPLPQLYPFSGGVPFSLDFDRSPLILSDTEMTRRLLPLGVF